MHHFPGEEQTEIVRVAGASRGLSFMVRRGVGIGSVQIERVEGRLEVVGDVGMSMIVVLDGTVVTDQGVALGAEDALTLAVTDTVTIGGQATIAVVRVGPPSFDI